MQVLIFGLALVLALNIGGSGAGAAMAAPCACGALARGRALALFGIMAALGAIWGGRHVVLTLSAGLVPRSAFTYQTVLAVSAAAAAALILANTLRVPQSTTQVLVAALAGVGLAHGSLNWGVLARIVLTWSLNPLLAFAICYALGRWLLPRIDRVLNRCGPVGERLQVLMLALCAAYMALGIGSNNVGNAVAPLVGGGLVSLPAGVALGGLAMGIGGLTVGRRLVSTTGREIAQLSLNRAALVSLVTATLILAAARLGMPSSYVQTSTLAVLGVSASDRPLLQILGQEVVRRIGLTWLASPMVAFCTGFWLVSA